MTLKWIIYYILFTVILMLTTGCDEAPEQPQVTKPSLSGNASGQSPPAANETVGFESSEKNISWPFISSDQSDEELAKKPLTKNYLLIFDGSGSMRDSGCAGEKPKIEVAKKAVVAWSKSVPQDANLGLYAFHDKGILNLPLSTDNRDIFIETVNQIQAGGNTPLTNAVDYAYDIFSQQGRRQLGYGNYTIVVVTDGIANSIDDLKLSVDMVLAKTPINIYSIGFCIGNNHSLNQPGRTIYKSADNPQQLQRGLSEVLAESESFDEDHFSN